jgi:hypothetical protein
LTWATRNRVNGGGNTIDKQRYGAKQTSYELTVRKFRHFACSLEVVLDERSTDKGVVADTIAADPRIEEQEGEQENQAQEKLRLPGAMCGRSAEVLQAHR